jgi:hypothetical protein
MESTIQNLKNYKDSTKLAKRAITWDIITFISTIIISILAVIIVIAILGVAGFSLEGLENQNSEIFENIAGGAIIGVLILLSAFLALVGIAITSLVFYLMWVYRVHKNAVAISGKNLFVSPAMHIWLYFIPFVLISILFLFNSILNSEAVSNESSIFDFLIEIISLIGAVLTGLVILDIVKKTKPENSNTRHITFTWFILIVVSGSLVLINSLFTSLGGIFVNLASGISILNFLLFIATFVIRLFMINKISEEQKLVTENLV